MTTIAISITKTLAYADVFDYPLTQGQLWKYLIGRSCTYRLFVQTMTQLVSQKKVIQHGHYFCLPRRSLLLEVRKKREQIARIKLQYVKKAASLLRMIPTVYFVGVSGSLAMHNASKDDDIDLFIITAPKALWITRLLCTILLEIVGMRRRPLQANQADKLCLNMFMSSDNLCLPVKEHDLYAAHEVVQVVPLVNKYQTHESFLYANRWVKKFLPHVRIGQRTKVVYRSSPVFAYVEKAVFLAQKYYMKRRLTQEVLTNTMIRFHPIDARTAVLSAYHKRWQELAGPK